MIFASNTVQIFLNLVSATDKNYTHLFWHLQIVGLLFRVTVATVMRRLAYMSRHAGTCWLQLPVKVAYSIGAAARVPFRDNCASSLLDTAAMALPSPTQIGNRWSSVPIPAEVARVCSEHTNTYYSAEFSGENH